jgi:hypothetical protein
LWRRPRTKLSCGAKERERERILGKAANTDVLMAVRNCEQEYVSFTSNIEYFISLPCTILQI